MNKIKILLESVIGKVLTFETYNMLKDIIRSGICFKDISSYEWKLARTITIIRANSRCGICGKLDEEVYHKIKLTPDNITNLEVSVNQYNLISLIYLLSSIDLGIYSNTHELCNVELLKYTVFLNMEDYSCNHITCFSIK